jgi:hypothetical protein
MHEIRETASLAAQKKGRPAGEGESRTTGMPGGEESDGVVVPMSPSNKATEQQAEAAEREEGRMPTEENTSQTHRPPAQDGQGVSQGLAGVRKVARERKQERFTTLLHHVTIDRLRAEFSRTEKECGARSGRRNVAGIRGRAGRSAGRSEGPDSPGSVPGATLTPDLHTESRRAGNARSGSRPWRTRSFNRPWGPSCMRFTRWTFPDSATGLGRGAVRTKRWTR